MDVSPIDGEVKELVSGPFLAVYNAQADTKVNKLYTLFSSVQGYNSKL